MSDLQEKYRALMNAVGVALDEMFNGEKKGPARETGFVLLVFPFGNADGQRCNYLSNGADRADMISLFREMAARFDGQSQHPETRA